MKILYIIFSITFFNVFNSLNAQDNRGLKISIDSDLNDFQFIIGENIFFFITIENVLGVPLSDISSDDLSHLYITKVLNKNTNEEYSTSLSTEKNVKNDIDYLIDTSSLRDAIRHRYEEEKIIHPSFKKSYYLSLPFVRFHNGDGSIFNGEILHYKKELNYPWLLLPGKYTATFEVNLGIHYERKIESTVEFEVIDFRSEKEKNDYLMLLDIQLKEFSKKWNHYAYSENRDFKNWDLFLVSTDVNFSYHNEALLLLLNTFNTNLGYDEIIHSEAFNNELTMYFFENTEQIRNDVLLKYFKYSMGHFSDFDQIDKLLLALKFKNPSISDNIIEKAVSYYGFKGLTNYAAQNK